MAVQPEAATVRLARHDDYKAACAINTNVYDGIDYLPVNYHNLLHDKNNRCYVLVLDGAVVGYQALRLINNGEALLQMASRIRPDLQGSGLIKVLSDTSLAEALEHFPTVTYTTRSSLYTNSYKNPKPGSTVKVVNVYNFNSWCPNFTALEYALKHLKDAFPHTDDVTPLSLDDTTGLARDPGFLNDVMKDSPFIMDYVYGSYRITQTNLQDMVAKHRVYVSRQPDGKITSISWSNTRLVSNYIGQSIFIQAPNASEDLRHCLFHLRHLRDTYNHEKPYMVDILINGRNDASTLVSTFESYWGKAQANFPHREGIDQLISSEQPIHM